MTALTLTSAFGSPLGLEFFPIFSFLSYLGTARGGTPCPRNCPQPPSCGFGCPWGRI